MYVQSVSQIQLQLHLFLSTNLFILFIDVFFLLFLQFYKRAPNVFLKIYANVSLKFVLTHITFSLMQTFALNFNVGCSLSFGLCLPVQS